MSPRTDSVYGFFCGGDPRTFRPDREGCTPEELANHAAACKLADEMEARGEFPDWDCPSGWEQYGNVVVHVLRAPFGVGVTTTIVECDEECGDA